MKKIYWLFIVLQGVFAASITLAEIPQEQSNNSAVNNDFASNMSLLPTDSSSWYLGAGVGLSEFIDACASDALSCDNKDTGYVLFGGWQPNDWFGLELSYAELGEASATYAFPAGTVLNGEGSAVDVAARFRWAFADRWGLYGKTGVAYTRLEADNGISSDSASELSLLFGGGVSYDFTDNWQTRLEYRFIDEMGDNVVGYTDNQFVSLNIAYYFGDRNATPLTPSSVMVPIMIPALAVNTVFDFDSTEMKVTETIDQMVARLLKFPTAIAQITGYSDNAGSATYNTTLSINRAKAVRDYMMSKGVDEKRISYQGVGSGESIIDNDTSNNRLLNRRVKVYSPPFEKSVNVNSESFQSQ
jgi:OOP family OmpA-OmpF porin